MTLIAVAMTFKEAADFIHTVVETVAIIIGGIWAWLAFFRRRLRFPRAALGHVVTHRRFGSSSYLVHVSLIIENRGEVLIRPGSMVVRLQQVLPEPADVLQAVEAGKGPMPEPHREVAWPLLADNASEFTKGEHELEPGETDRVEYDFFIPDDVRTIEVYSHIANNSKSERNIGWTETTFYDLA